MNSPTNQPLSGKLDFGIDVPGIRQGMLAAGVAGLFIAVAVGLIRTYLEQISSNFAMSLVAVSLLIAAYGFFMGSYMTWASRVGKLRTRQRLLDLASQMLGWTGSEKVLDVGCGRGLMLIGAALRLKQGAAIGIDLWRTEDQAGNSLDAALNNVRLAGVADRVCIDTGDARNLPYPNESFDLVLSHWVIHNLPDANDRRQTLNEMLRVLRPGGVIALADIEFINDYGRHLSSCGVVNIRKLSGGFEAAVMGILSGGSYRPQALLARKV